MSENSPQTAPVSAIIPTWNRTEQLGETIRKLLSCHPLPAEIIVHVDFGDTASAPYLAAEFPSVIVLQSERQMGPGGGRNRLMAAARQPYVASFDDDSYPVDTDYFQRLVDLFERHPSAGILQTAVYHRGEDILPQEDASSETADFIGCGCALRRSAFNETGGYVPRRVPYGMEETDMSLQMLDRGWSIVYNPSLRIYHDTDLHHHESAFVTAGTIVNRALQAYLRYPPSYLAFGVGQYLRRIGWLIANGRYAGLVPGLLDTIPEVWRHRKLRRPVSRDAVQKYLSLRKPQHELRREPMGLQVES